jgi:hypothetical protein
MSRPSFCKCEDWPCCGCGHEASQESQHEAALELEDDLREMNDLNGEPDDHDDGMSDVEADADTLRSAGWGTDEDYGDTPLADFYDGE